MAYKAFQDFYHEQSIKHLLLHDHKGVLVSPPFATESCKDYSKVLCIDGNQQWTIDLDLPPVTSKFNGAITIGDSIWFIPYGIWDDFNTVVQLKNFEPIYHKINMPGKGQFYSTATNGATAFSFPLGYKDTSYGLYISNDTVSVIPFDKQSHMKLHMGTVYCNGRYWSAPRSDNPGYINMMSFDGDKLTAYPIDVKNPSVTRKYTDIIVKGTVMYVLPFGEQPGMTELIEFDTVTNTYTLHELSMPDFAKKFNCGVLVDDTIVALPYGDDNTEDSNYGLVYDTNTGEHFTFDIGITHGGKYRFRSGISYKGNAVFLPSGTPACPILVINKQGQVIHEQYMSEYLLGRPVIHNESLMTMAHNLSTQESQLLLLDSFLK